MGTVGLRDRLLFPDQLVSTDRRLFANQLDPSATPPICSLYQDSTTQGLVFNLESDCAESPQALVEVFVAVMKHCGLKQLVEEVILPYAFPLESLS